MSHFGEKIYLVSAQERAKKQTAYLAISNGDTALTIAVHFDPVHKYY